MSEFWNNVYKSDNSFFGDNPSNFAIRCYNHMKEKHNSRKILELGAGHGRDTLFFASNGIEVDALDYSAPAIEILDKMAKEKRLPIKAQIFDVNNQLPYPDGYFEKAGWHIYAGGYQGAIASLEPFKYCPWCVKKLAKP